MAISPLEERETKMEIENVEIENVEIENVESAASTADKLIDHLVSKLIVGKTTNYTEAYKAAGVRWCNQLFAPLAAVQTAALSNNLFDLTPLVTNNDGTVPEEKVFREGHPYKSHKAWFAGLRAFKASLMTADGDVDLDKVEKYTEALKNGIKKKAVKKKFVPVSF